LILSTLDRTALADAVERDGWAVTPPVVPERDVDSVLAELAPLGVASRGGVRNLLDTSPSVRSLALSPAVRAVAEAVLGEHCFAVRAILFDKTPDANWKVVWHQDLTIAVRKRADVAGFGPWSDKAGVPHVQAPAELLARMLAVRVHLDDCGAQNGPVRVISGSHREGRLTAAEVESRRVATAPVDCLVARGGVLAFRPLILHASSPATTPAHRRVVHFEFAIDELPPPLEWHARVV
jgi:ectoine hydroxylase-related dioxygenase (phytanoyl-CoA dioxygenase family)